MLMPAAKSPLLDRDFSTQAFKHSTYPETYVLVKFYFGKGDLARGRIISSHGET
jgi:hypothetical protein